MKPMDARFTTGKIVDRAGLECFMTMDFDDVFGREARAHSRERRNLRAGATTVQA
jgi:hypothetical protein